MGQGTEALIPYRLWIALAFSRIPGNALSFWIRQTLKWSRGAPRLPHESKENLFAYLSATAPAALEPARARELDLRARYRLDPLAAASTQALYRKNLYLIDVLEQACAGLGPPPSAAGGPIRALEMGAQDWHYVFGLERWLRHAGGQAGAGREVRLRGVEIDGYGIYPDFRSRKDYAEAYAAQTGNPQVTYQVADFLKHGGEACDVLTWFYPFVTRHHLLLWGLPLRFFQPEKLLDKAASLLKPGGWMLAFAHTAREHALFLELGKAAPGFALVREGRAGSELVDFHRDVADRRFSVWLRK